MDERQFELLKITVKLRNENDQEGNTWYSTAGEPDIQLHMDRAVYVAMGKPENILVEITPA